MMNLMAHRAGFTPIRLSKGVLRTETAAMAGIAALQTRGVSTKCALLYHSFALYATLSAAYLKK